MTPERAIGVLTAAVILAILCVLLVWLIRQSGVAW